ncbi:MAG: BrnT family toxin [Elusimicrobiota bacterium]
MNKKFGSFIWDQQKELINIEKYGIDFSSVAKAFLDPHRVIAEDVTHSKEEERFYCFGRVGDCIMTVRFTYRGNVIRIYGAGYWRKGRKIYEEQNKIY